jgi:exonuclease III
MRIATWNLMQAMKPKKAPTFLWNWAEEHIQPDVMVFTEARISKEHVEDGWSALWEPAGIYPHIPRSWGTVIASPTCELIPVNYATRRLRKTQLEFKWPGAIQVADIISQGERWATIVGLYGVLRNLDGQKALNAVTSMRHFMGQLEPLLHSRSGDRVLIAGDFNVWPFMAADLIGDYGLTDLVEHTGNERSPLDDCANCNYLIDQGRPPVEKCGHLWTHRNEGGPNPTKQQIDFIFATNELVGELKSVSGGVADFPDVWEVSDHAPVIADFIF